MYERERHVRRINSIEPRVDASAGPQRTPDLLTDLP